MGSQENPALRIGPDEYQNNFLRANQSGSVHVLEFLVVPVISISGGSSSIPTAGRLSMPVADWIGCGTVRSSQLYVSLALNAVALFALN